MATTSRSSGPPKPENRGEGRRRRLSVGRRREELITAALELFSSRELETVSIDDIAARAGASRALVYHYFGGKQELYMAALRSAAKEFEERLRPKSEGRPLDDLKRGLTRYFDYVEEHAAGFAALLRGGPANRTGEVGEIIESVRLRLLEIISEAMGLAEPGPVLRLSLRSWLSSVETVGLDWLERRDVDREKLERMLADQMIALLGVAANHDPQVNEAFERLVQEQFPS